MVRPGYKQTEVGEIPEDWYVVPLGELARLERGKFSARPRNDPKYFGGDVPFIQTGDVTRSNGRNVGYSQTLNEAGLGVSKIFPERSLYFTIAANIGDLAIVPFQAACPDSLITIQPRQGFDKEWLFHALRRNKPEFQVIATSNAQLNINLEKLNPYLVVVPKTESEQRKIAKVLSDVDDLITSLEKLITKKRNIKTGTMQQLLTGKKRLSEFGKGKGYKNTELGEIPADWNIKTYGEVFRFLTTASNSRGDLMESGEVAYIHYGDIHTRFNFSLDFRFDAVPRIPKAMITSAAYLKDGDLIMADASEDYEGIGKSIEVLGLGDCRAIAGLHTFLLRDTDNIFAPGYKGYLHVISVVKESLDRLATGLKVYGLSKNSLQQVLIPVPSYPEQEHISKVLTNMEHELECLRIKLYKTKAIRKGMMQELLTGRTRLVNVPEATLEQERLHGT